MPNGKPVWAQFYVYYLADIFTIKSLIALAWCSILVVFLVYFVIFREFKYSDTTVEINEIQSLLIKSLETWYIRNVQMEEISEQF